MGMQASCRIYSARTGAHIVIHSLTLRDTAGARACSSLSIPLNVLQAHIHIIQSEQLTGLTTTDIPLDTFQVDEHTPIELVAVVTLNIIMVDAIQRKRAWLDLEQEGRAERVERKMEGEGKRHGLGQTQT